MKKIQYFRARPKSIKMLCAAVSMLLLAGVQPLYAQSADNELEQWTGDFEEMLQRRQIRALVVYNKLFYFLDGAQQRGTSYDAMELFRKFIDKKYNLKSRKFNVIMIPVSRDDLIPALLDGRGDIALANLTITPERLELVDFSDPFVKDVREVVVTGPAGPEVNALADLAGQEVYVRESSSYYASLLALNEQLTGNGLAPVELKLVEEHLEDSDLLEMVNAGLIPMVIVDNHKAQFWKGVFDQINVHEDLAISVGGSIGWAFRKNSPTLKNIINQFVKQGKKGTLNGNMILNRYLRDNKWAKNALDGDALGRMNATADIFKKYASQYDFDWLMLAALGFQESGLDQDVRSGAGAIGVMQVLPTTAADSNVNIDKINEIENNIHAGTKYLRFLRSRYFSDPEISPLNQTLLAFASYNAGPAKIAKLRKEARERGLDPNVWFGNVERIVAKKVGRETVQYVSNIYKYYIAYSELYSRSEERESARSKLLETLE